MDVFLSPFGSSRWSSTMSSVTLLSETSVLLTGGGKTSKLAFVVFFRDDPVDSWVLLDSLMSWINKDNLEEFVGGILSYPVRVENTHVAASSANLLFSDISVRSGFLELSDTLMDWLTENGTLVDCSLSTSSSDSDSVDRVALLLLEAECSGLVESRWLRGSVDSWKLSVLPRSDSHDETKHIGLLLSPQFLKILICTHLIIK